MTYRTRTLRMAAVERVAEGAGRPVGSAALTDHDAWLLAALLTPGREGPEPPDRDEPDADPELREMLLAAATDEARPEAVPERAVRRVPRGILLRDR